MKKVLFVCTGNTCRSPMAEAAAKNIIKNRGLENIRVSSAGIFANEGKPVSKNAKEALALFGLKTLHKARVLTEEMIKNNTFVITMTKEQKEMFREYPNVFSIREYTGLEDIQDPYGESLVSYVDVLKKIINAVEIILKKIIGD